MKLIVCIFVLAFFASCEDGYYRSAFKARKEEKQKKAFNNDVRKRLEAELDYEKDLNLITYHPKDRYETEIFFLGFEYEKPISIENARELLIKITDHFVNIANLEKNKHSVLEDCFYEFSNVEIIVYLRNAEGVIKGDDNLSIIAANNNLFKYIIIDSETGSLKTIYKEDYEKALQRPIVEQSLLIQLAKIKARRR